MIVCRDALTKMKDVYIKNPHLGDPDSIDPRLDEITQSLEKLQLEAQKFEVISLCLSPFLFLILIFHNIHNILCFF